MITAQQKEQIKEIIGKFRQSFVGIFGYYTRNKHSPDSDLDVLVDFDSKFTKTKLN